MFDEIIAKIVFGVIILVLLLPTVAWRVYKRWHISKSRKEIVSKPFVCPSCGCRFYAKNIWIRPMGEDKAYLKCPACGKRDICGRPYDLDMNEK